MRKRINKLPSFLIIGMAKCGTTSLYNMLIQHPKIQPAKRKELYFFEKDDIYEKGINFYRKQFNSCAEDEICGEATPYYLYYKKTPARVKNLLPNVKLIVLLRNPITRSYSHFYGYLRLCKKKKQIPIALTLKEFLEKIEKNPEVKLNYRGQNFLKKSIYVDMLKHWFKYFSRNQIMIIKSEDFFKSPQLITNTVFEFLGLSKYNVKIRHDLKTEEMNLVLLKVRRYAKLSQFVIDYLKNYYAQYNKRLYQLIERDMNWENEI